MTSAADSNPPGGTRPSLVPAAMASAGAGMVHATAAGSHSGDQTLVLIFALVAAAQIGWAALALARPDRLTAALGAGLSLAAVAAWGLSRTAGLPVISSLSEREPLGTQDIVAAALGAVAFAVAGWVAAGRPGFVLARLPVASGAVVLVLAVIGMTAEHADGPSHAHAHGPSAAVGDEPGDVAHDLEGHVGGAPAAADDAQDIPSGPIVSLDDPRLTPEQRQAAQALIDETHLAMSAFTDVASVEAAGYLSIGDGGTGWEHFIHLGHIANQEMLDPERIESIVFRVNPDGSKDLASAMYILPPGYTMADVPEIAGELTTWHDHQDLCWEGIRVVGRTDADGNCARGVFRGTSPMLHVWLIEHPCGPFAGIDGAHGAGCGHTHDSALGQ